MRVMWMLALALMTWTISAPVLAQSAEELASARRLFTEALADQKDQHFESALEKYRRVQGVKDTAPVRYRMGSCLEALGRFVEANESYKAAMRLGSDDAAQREVVAASRERLAVVGTRIATLEVRLPERADVDPPLQVQLEIDGQKVDTEKLKSGLPVDPGRHSVAAISGGSVIFRSDVRLPEGGHLAVSIPAAGVATPIAPATTPEGAAGPNAAGAAETTPTGGSRQTAIVTLAAGGALIVGSGVFALLERGQAADLQHYLDQCPGGKCGALRTQINDADSRALTFRSLSWGLGLTGAIAGGVGTYLYLTSRPEARASALRITPFGTQGGGGLVLGGEF